MVEALRHRDEDGIMRTFLDRYSTIVNHDQIILEEEPSPLPALMHHLMRQAKYHPAVGHQGALEPHELASNPHHLAAAFDLDMSYGHVPIRE